MLVIERKIGHKILIRKKAPRFLLWLKTAIWKWNVLKPKVRP